MRALVNAAARPEAVAAPVADAAAFHASLPGYRPTPVHELTSIADELGLAAVRVKDESERLGLPAFKVLGASWAVERLLAARPGSTRSSPPAPGTTGVRSPASPRCGAFTAACSSPRAPPSLVASQSQAREPRS